MVEHEVKASSADVYPKFTPGPDLAPVVALFPRL